MNADEFYYFLDHPDSVDGKLQEELLFLVREYPLFQTGWMLYMKSLEEDQRSDGSLEEGAIRLPDRKKMYMMLNPNQGMAYAQKTQVFHAKGDPDSGDIQNKAQLQGNSLIDKFLSSDPGKLGKMQNPNSEENIAENESILQSVTEKNDLVTETLALLYFQQKKYDKALEAFRKLSLK